MEERIQKIIAAAGIASRRAAEEIILEGRVRVNGKVVSELGTKADPEHDHIKVDGKLIKPKQPKAYIMLNKPAGVVTTMSDPEGRPVVADLLRGVRTRVYPVGRLDYDTEGLLLLTNDGDFAFRVTHPRHELPKTYLVKIKGALEDRQVEELERGVFLKDGKTAPARVKKLRREESNSWVEITIHEGRKRQVRRMVDHTGHSVIKLKRVRVGNLSLGDLALGSFRHLTPEEVIAVQEMAQGGDGGRAGEETKPSRRPAAASHVPEFIEGPNPRARILEKGTARRADAPRFSRSSAGGGRRRRPEGRERTFEIQARKSGQQGERQERWGSGQGEKRFVKPSVVGERPHHHGGPRQDEGLRPKMGQRRPYGTRWPGTVEGYGQKRGHSRSFGERSLPGDRSDRRTVSAGDRKGKRLSGKPFYGGKDRPYSRPDTRQGKDTGQSGKRPFSSARSRTQDGSLGREAYGQRSLDRNEWRGGERKRGMASFGGKRGSRTEKTVRGTNDKHRGRAGSVPRPSGRPQRNPKGPGSGRTGSQGMRSR